MRYRPLVAATFACTLACTLASPASGQLASDFAVTVAPNYRAFTLDESLAASGASLLLLPVAVQVPFGDRFAFDVYAAWASGTVETATGDLSLDGPVDTQLRGTWAAMPWARVTFGLNLPTGNGTHTAEEAQVAAVLSTDQLGFREASFGTGLGITTGVALAHQLGEWGVGYGASYRMAGEFEPSEEASTVYSPGDELVARIAVDRNVGSSGKLTLGGTVQHFSDDEFGDNLFQPGMRVRGDASYAFRAGTRTTMRVYVTDLWRQQGEVSLLSDPAAGSGTVGAQNVIVVGTSANLGGRLNFAPRADVRVLTHQEGSGSGWLGGVGAGIGTRIAGVEAAPRARFMFGAIESASGENGGVTGFEVELALRF